MIQDYSIWEYQAYHSIWDVCIIGSGINGISTGISILEKKPDTRVLIVDRWFIPLGASTRNAGFSCFGSPTEILHDISTMGEDVAMSLVSKRWKGLQKLKTRLKDSNAQYETSGGYELYHQTQFEIITSSLQYLNKLLHEVIGEKDVFKSVPVPEGIRGFSGAVFNPHEGQLHPGFMMEHLKEKYLSLGGILWTGLNVDSIDEADGFMMVKSKLAIPLKSRHVVVATNAFAKDLVPGLDMHAARNHVLVTEPIPGLSWKGCFHFDRGFYYFRNVDNRILLGGARNQDMLNENTDQFGRNSLIVEALEKFLFDHLAEADTRIDYQWSGIIGVGEQKLPIIKSISPRLTVGVKCSGMGIALASVIGEELADLVLQQPE